VTVGYAALLEARVARTGTLLCLGLDPDPAALPPGFAPDVHGTEAFARLLVEAAVPFAAAVKANLAFFEAFGSAGLAALERIRADLPVDVPFVADAKRGDIGSTAARHVVALFDGLGAHAVTVSPYVGGEALAPLLERAGRCVYVLCRTSNPGAAELQELPVGPDEATAAPSEPLYLRVARRALAWQARYGTVGLVVGATAPDELAAVRRVAPQLPFLIPGVGAQGGDAAAVLELAGATAGPAATSATRGVLVNVSRGITAAALGAADPGAALAAAAADWAARLRCYDTEPPQRTPLEDRSTHVW
jgi:orotidine-5'-phosphate decarboxylase